MSAASPVTVLMPVRNGMPYLRDAISSVLEQTHTDFELLVVDDGSTDGTAEYLAGIRDDRLRVVPTRKSGLVNALNYGLEQAQHELVARMDADDVSAPERLSIQTAVMEGDRDLVAVGCCYRIVDEAGAVIVEQHVPSIPSYAERQLYFRDAFAHASMMFRRSAVVGIGGYREIGPCEDYDLWLRLLGLGRVIGACGPPLFTYRVVSSGVSQTKAAQQDECRRATRASAMQARPLRVPSPGRIVIEGREHLSRAEHCPGTSVTYAFDHLALTRVLLAQGRHADAARCALGLLAFFVRYPRALAVLPPLSWLVLRFTAGPRTAEQIAAAALGRRGRIPAATADDC